jgi:hypothetical protein
MSSKKFLSYSMKLLPTLSPALIGPRFLRRPVFGVLFLGGTVFGEGTFFGGGTVFGGGTFFWSGDLFLEGGTCFWRGTVFEGPVRF